MRDRLRKVVFSVFVLWAVLLLETQPAPDWKWVCVVKGEKVVWGGRGESVQEGLCLGG